MGIHKKPRCTALKPDCENCPFPDCIATTNDIMKQIAYEEKIDLLARNDEMFNLYLNGVEGADLADKYGLSHSRVKRILADERKRRAACAQNC